MAFVQRQQDKPYEYCSTMTTSKSRCLLRMKTAEIARKKKGKTPDREKINTHVSSGCCVHSTFTYGDVFDQLKMDHGKDYIQKFIEYIKDEVKQLYATFP